MSDTERDMIREGRSQGMLHMWYKYRTEIILVSLLSLAASALRIPSLTLNSFWWDELFTVATVLNPFKKQLSILWHDVHPPLFTLLANLGGMMRGYDELGFRLVPAFIGIITVPAVFLVFKRSFGVLTSFVIAVLVLLLPSHIYYSHEVRSYSLAFLLSAVSLGSLFHYQTDPSVKHRWILAATCAVLFSTHYISLFYIAAVLFAACIAIEDHGRMKWKKGFRLCLATFVLMIPTLPHFLYARFNMHSFWAGPVNVRRVKLTLLSLFQNNKPLAYIYLILIFVAIAAAVFRKDRILSRRVCMLSVLSILPLTGVLVVSVLSPGSSILIPRIMFVFAPPIIVLAAVGLTSLPHKTVVPGMLLLISGFFIWWVSSSSYYTVSTKSDFRGIAQEVARLEESYGDFLLISLDPDFVDRKVGEKRLLGYYFDKYGVQSSFFTLPKDLKSGELLHNIRTAAGRRDGKVVLVSHHFPVRKHIMEVCDQYFQKEFDKRFGKINFLIGYRITG